MELSLSHYSVRVPKIVPRVCRASSCNNKLVQINKPKSNTIIKTCTSKYPILPVGLYGESRSFKSLSYGQHRPTSIQARAQVESADSNCESNSLFTKISRFGNASYKFLRPYAMQQAIVATISLFARVLVENPKLFNWSLLFKAFPGLIAIIFANAYYIGVNQIYDADIDRVNKPYLPIPSGDLSLKSAWFLVIFDLLAGLSILRLMNADLITTSLFSLGLFLGTIYSVPPIRLKRSSITTSLVLATMGGVIHNIGVSYATRVSLGLTSWWSPPVAFITSFVTVFFLIITIIKDLTDVEGDSKFNIQTFAAKFGPRNVAFLGTGMLLVNYISAILAAIYMPQAFKSYLMLPVHAILAFCLLFQARKLDQANYSKEASASFFQFLWKLLNLEYLLFPFI